MQSHLRPGELLTLVLAAAAPLLAQQTEPGPARIAAPPDEEREACRARIHASRAKAFADAVSAAGKQQLGVELLVEAKDLDPSAQHYALVDEARLLMLGAGELQAACDCAATLGHDYRIDELQLQADTLEALDGTFRAREHRLEIAMHRLALLRRATAAGRPELALSLTRSVTLARQAGHPMPKAYEALERSELARAFRGARDHRAAEAKRQELTEDAEAPEANESLGTYLCLVQGRWLAGVGHLAKGADEALAAAATLEQRGASDDAGRLAIADAWWRVAEQRPRHRRAARLHAADTYAQMATIDGDEHATAAARVAEVRAALRDEIAALAIATAGPADTQLQEAAVAILAERYPALITAEIAADVLDDCRPTVVGTGEDWGEVVILDAALSEAERRAVTAKMTTLLDEKVPGARAVGDVIMINVVGMWLADIPERARAAARFPIRQGTAGAVILSVDGDFKGKSATQQTPPVGAVFWMAGDTRVANLREFVTAFVATADAAARGWNRARVVYTYPVRRATMTDHFRFTDEAIEGLRKTLRQLEW